MSLTEYPLAGASLALGLIALRAFPILVASYAAPELSVLRKAVALAVYGGVALLSVRYADFVCRDLLSAYCYLCAVSLPFFFWPARVPRAVTFALVSACFVVLPGLGWHANGFALLLGWEVALSIFSYTAETDRASRDFGGYWFFVFVNPTVAYPRRGRRFDARGAWSVGLPRALAGVASLLLCGALGALDTVNFPGGEGITRNLFDSALRLAQLYAAHWGLTSLQIGLLRQLGHEIPECYRQPYRAKNPADFWQRWNTYIGAWARLYVFEPVVRTLGAGPGARARDRRWFVLFSGVTATFLAVGALHDLYASLATGTPSWTATAWFGVNALALVLWDAVAKALKRRTSSWVARVAAAAAMVSLVTMFAVAFP